MPNVSDRAAKLLYRCRRAEQLCARCPNDGRRVTPAMRGKSACRSCLEASARSLRAIYAERVKRGVCPRCGVSEPESGRVMCRVCREGHVARVQKWRRKKKSQEHQATQEAA